MTRLRLLLPPLLVLLAALPADARRGGPGPGRPLWPRKGNTDAMLYAKAERLQAQMWNHLSPEGLLIVRHARGADGAQLSRAALWRSDAAMWTGCYAAAQACRWHVTRDPDAHAQMAHLAKGLAALSAVTGVPGAFGRNVGRPAKPGAGEKIIPSPTKDGRWFRPDVSRDQLAGVTLGWAFIGRYADDPVLERLAAAQMRAIAIKLHQDKMWLRDYLGHRTEYGELRADVEFLPFLRNGPLAAIGFATMVAAADLNPGDATLAGIVRKLDRDNWDRALATQHVGITSLVNSSNVNMVTLSLLVIARSGQRDGRYGHFAKKGLESLRAATVGWWNAGTTACFLLSGLPKRRDMLLGEVRATLHAMPHSEQPRVLVRRWHANRIAPIWMRQPSSWHWTNDVTFHHEWRRGTSLGPEVIWTGADWLFAYWIARAAGLLTPETGPGADARSSRIEAPRPAWTR